MKTQFLIGLCILVAYSSTQTLNMRTQTRRVLQSQNATCYVINNNTNAIACIDNTTSPNYVVNYTTVNTSTSVMPTNITSFFAFNFTTTLTITNTTTALFPTNTTNIFTSNTTQIANCNDTSANSTVCTLYITMTDLYDAGNSTSNLTINSTTSNYQEGMTNTTSNATQYPLITRVISYGPYMTNCTSDQSCFDYLMPNYTNTTYSYSYMVSNQTKISNNCLWYTNKAKVSQGAKVSACKAAPFNSACTTATKTHLVLASWKVHWCMSCSTAQGNTRKASLAKKAQCGTNASPLCQQAKTLVWKRVINQNHVCRF